MPSPTGAESSPLPPPVPVSAAGRDSGTGLPLRRQAVFPPFFTAGTGQSYAFRDKKKEHTTTFSTILTVCLFFSESPFYPLAQPPGPVMDYNPRFGRPTARKAPGRPSEGPRKPVRTPHGPVRPLPAVPRKRASARPFPESMGLPDPPGNCPSQPHRKQAPPRPSPEKASARRRSARFVRIHAPVPPPPLPRASGRRRSKVAPQESRSGDIRRPGSTLSAARRPSDTTKSRKKHDKRQYCKKDEIILASYREIFYLCRTNRTFGTEKRTKRFHSGRFRHSID